MKSIWLCVGLVQLAMAAINVPFALEGETLNIVSLAFCAGMALCSFVLSVAAR